MTVFRYGPVDLYLVVVGTDGNTDVALAKLGEDNTRGLELAVERVLAGRLARGGGEVLRTERVPAPMVNALMDLYEPVEGR